jgi:hypothetical protein
MKKMLPVVIPVIALFFIVAGCNQTKKKKTDEPNPEQILAATDTFHLVDKKEEILKKITQLHESPDIVPLINEAGASYIMDLTVPIENTERLLTRDKLSFFWGMLVFDLIYAKVYNRQDRLAEVADLEYRFKMDLGLEEELKKAERYNERIQQNKDNPDSLNILFEEATETWMNDMSSDHFNVLVYSCVGNNVEALYILSQLTLLASDNTDLLHLVNQHRASLSEFFSLIGLIAEDQNIQPYYENLARIASLFQVHEEITEAELEEIALLAEEVRNDMIR